MFTLDTRELFDLDRQLTAAGRVFTPALTGRAMRLALKPMLEAARQQAPKGRLKVRSAATRTGSNGKTKRDGTYDKGGATRRDLRVKIVAGRNGEVIRGLVGVSKSRGRVGWRTHLITRANKNRRNPDNFLQRAENATVNVAISTFGAAAQETVRKILARL